MISFNDTWIDIECPRCGYAVDLQLVDAKAEATMFCHNCKAIIRLRDHEASVHSGLAAIDAAFQKLEQTFKRFGK